MEINIVPCPNREHLDSDADTTCKKDCELCNGSGFVEDKYELKLPVNIDVSSYFSNK